MSLTRDIDERLLSLDWGAIEASLWEWGYAKAGPLLAPAECAELIALYADDSRFRSRVDMARYRFGVGEYKYFAHPLPPLVRALREGAYPPLAAIANRWEAALGAATRHPADLASFLTRCRRRGQDKEPEIQSMRRLAERNPVIVGPMPRVLFPVRPLVLPG